MDRISIVYCGDITSLTKYGCSRDHHPDKKQVTLDRSIGAAGDCPYRYGGRGRQLNDRVRNIR